MTKNRNIRQDRIQEHQHRGHQYKRSDNDEETVGQNRTWNMRSPEKNRTQQASEQTLRYHLMDVPRPIRTGLLACKAEKALADKQLKIDEMKMEIFQKEKGANTISVFQPQAEIYSSDFYTERAAREKIHEEKERLATQLEYVKKQNSQLQEEMESLGRHSMSEMQRRHVSRGANPQGPTSPRNLQGGDWQQQNIPDHACPKCGEVLPDLDSLQIHIMDCII
ncbi:optineurin-like [Siphateles boraxobius]|uniref:optineurin-like n=1 Tax=Siphateles boraxobius TaxID=180520 RepID=UPI0040639E2F